MDPIDRDAALRELRALEDSAEIIPYSNAREYAILILQDAQKRLLKLPSTQPEPLSDAYMKAVWIWLLDYQIKAAELKGSYTPYEVLSWVANDWRKEHEGSD